ncbi:MAG: NADH-quinone oxidoreductase subunit NuoK [Candidatus Omnitrophica bacterium]|nr:NADH-quinone oxidoreductase subunit NuoK [Candidatus Omnitrophota bacterium]
MPLGHFVILSMFIFCIGVFGVLTQRNAIRFLISVELILNAANINLVAFNKYYGSPDGLGQIFALFVIAIAAAASVVGLVLVIAIYRLRKSVFIDDFNLLKW